MIAEKKLVQEFAYTVAMQKGMRSDIGSTPRVRELSRLLRSTKPGICLHSARAYTEVFRANEADPPPLRFAKAFRRMVETIPPAIYDGELIVGLSSCGLKKIPVLPVNHAAWLDRELDTLSTRSVNPFTVTGGQIRECRELLAWWKDKTQYDMIRRRMPPDLFSKVQGTGWGECGGYFHQGGSHFGAFFDPILQGGLISHERRIKEKLAALDPVDPDDIGKEPFYKGLLMTIESIRLYAAKFSEKAKDLASEEKDPARRQELLAIADRTAQVPYYPARNFREAIQSIWFIQLCLHMEGPGMAYTIGRLDQLAYPYYRADLEKGDITEQEALEILELFFLKISGNLWLCDSVTAARAAGLFPGQTVCIGGTDARGHDASNELSYLILEATKSVRTVQPDIAMLVHPRETPYELKMKGAELVALGLGMPKFISTETLKAQMMAVGFSLKEARSGWIRGCTEFYGPGGRQYGYPSGAKFNVGLCLECALYNGKKRMPGQNMSGQVLGPETGDPRGFKTFDAFRDAIKRQITRQLRDAHSAAMYAEKVKIETLPLLLQSLTTESCIEKALSAHAGGADIRTGPSLSIMGGIATVGDSLAAIRYCIYDKKTLTWDRLLAAIDADYVGYEDVRQQLIDAPKFGNDDDYADALAVEIWQYFCDECHKLKLPFGERVLPSSSIATGYAAAGEFTWATPDGRKAGTPLSCHVGPSEGRDTHGPFAHIRSVTKLGLDTGFGTIHNMYFVNVDSRERLHQLIDIVDTYFSMGGHHIQINCQDKETYLDAQAHPEEYPTLIVRVSGYNANFVELPKYNQDEIISRSELNV
jgi:pyruvate formate-lyase/glycerol dehydratase family glycyl radical enzyme